MLSGSVNYTWGASPPLTADLSPILINGYVQEPACGYEFRVTPKVWYKNRSAEPDYLVVPTFEIDVANGLVFGIQKCAPEVNQNDPECANAPFSYTMNIRWFVDAIDPNGNIVYTDSEFDFDIDVANPCGDDVVKFQSEIDDFTYLI